MQGATHHEQALRFLRREADENENPLGVTLQTLLEFKHICTDSRRFTRPLTMRQALDWSQAIWNGKEFQRLIPTVEVLDRTVELMRRLDLGRKRILDTSLAATLEAAAVTKLATFNAKHFVIFRFLDVVVPD